MTGLDPDIIAGVAFLVFSVLIVGFGGALLVRLRRGGGIEKAFLNLVLHAARRRRFLIEVSAMAAILVAGLIVGAAALILPEGSEGEELGLVVVFMTGAVVVLVLALEGLRDTELSIEDELRAIGMFPHLSAMIARNTREPVPNQLGGYVPDFGEAARAAEDGGG